MKKGEIRDAQLANLIAEELDYALSSANDPRLAELIVTRVIPKPGGGHFIVYVAPHEGVGSCNSHAEMKQLLAKASSYLRSELSSVLNLKRSPDLTIEPDPLYSCSWKS